MIWSRCGGCSSRRPAAGWGTKASDPAVVLSCSNRAEVSPSPGIFARRVRKILRLHKPLEDGRKRRYGKASQGKAEVTMVGTRPALHRSGIGTSLAYASLCKLRFLNA